MKIISKFNEHYDRFLSPSSFSEDLVYERKLNDTVSVSKEKNIEENNINETILTELNKVFEKYLQDKGYSFSLIIAGETITPFITRVSNIGNNFNDYDFIYEDREEDMTKVETEFMNRNFNDLYNSIREITSAPIVTYSQYEGSYLLPESIKMKRGANFNSPLYYLNAHKYLDGAILLKEIELFLNKLKYKENKKS